MIGCAHSKWCGHPSVRRKSGMIGKLKGPEILCALPPYYNIRYLLGQYRHPTRLSVVPESQHQSGPLSINTTSRIPTSNVLILASTPPKPLTGLSIRKNIDITIKALNGGNLGGRLESNAELWPNGF